MLMLQCYVRPSVVCNILCIVAKRCDLRKNCLKKQKGNGLRGPITSRNTLKSKW